MKLDEAWLRAHLPPEGRDASIDCFSGEYLDGLTVMAEGERGGPDTVVYRAKDDEDLRWWQLEQICRFLPEKGQKKKTWRWYRHHAEGGQWRYVELRHYDYNAIEDTRLYGFECFLRNLKYGFPPERWEEKVREYVSLMNCWYSVHTGTMTGKRSASSRSAIPGSTTRPAGRKSRSRARSSGSSTERSRRRSP